MPTEAFFQRLLACRVHGVDAAGQVVIRRQLKRNCLHARLLRIVGASAGPAPVALACRWRSRPQHQKRTHAPRNTPAKNRFIKSKTISSPSALQPPLCGGFNESGP